MTSKLKGRTYEEIHGAEKAQEMKAQKREHNKNFDSVAHLRGKTYEEIYGVEGAKEQRAKRSGYSRITGPCTTYKECPICGEEFNARGLGNHINRCKRIRDYLPENRCIFCEEWIGYDGNKSFCKSCNDFINAECKDIDPWAVKLHLVNIEKTSRPGFIENSRKAMSDYLEKHPEQHPNRLVAGLGRSKEDCTGPQWSLYQIVSKHHDCEFNHYVNCNGQKRFIDVAIEELKLGFEYDGEYFHQDIEEDYIRDQQLKEQGWRIMHFNKFSNMHQEVAKIMLNGSGITI